MRYSRPYGQLQRHTHVSESPAAAAAHEKRMRRRRRNLGESEPKPPKPATHGVITVDGAPIAYTGVTVTSPTWFCLLIDHPTDHGIVLKGKGRDSWAYCPHPNCQGWSWGPGPRAQLRRQLAGHHS